MSFLSGPSRKEGSAARLIAVPRRTSARKKLLPNADTAITFFTAPLAARKLLATEKAAKDTNILAKALSPFMPREKSPFLLGPPKRRSKTSLAAIASDVAYATESADNTFAENDQPAPSLPLVKPKDKMSEASYTSNTYSRYFFAGPSSEKHNRSLISGKVNCSPKTPA